MSNQDTSSRKLESLEGEEKQILGWVASLEKLIEAVDKSNIDAERKTELLLHMAAIRNELAAGHWPNVGEASAVQTLAHEAGEIEQVAQDWQALSMQLAQWVKAISDSLGIK
ncbi:MAG: hypothetical protein RLZZ488_414 [Pseudomonadota bacterium]|jgi:hypothetical protein